MTWPAWTRPVTEGITERDGVRLAYAVHGSGPANLVLLPTWSIIHSQFWKAQVPYLARRFRVITFDGRGSGGSDRPAGAAAYENAAYSADTLAVMDAAGADRAVLVGLSSGAMWAMQVAAEHPERAAGLVLIGAPYAGWQPNAHRDVSVWADPPEGQPQGWSLYNRHVWLGDGYDEFVEFFFGQMFPEPHSTKQREDCARWAHEISPQTLVDATAGRLGVDGAAFVDMSTLIDAVRCPALVIHGSADLVRPLDNGRRIAEDLAAELVVVEGGGHGPMTRDPVLVNREIDRFAGRVLADRLPRTPRTWARALRRRPRVLYLSSPIGLGHARRDLAIAEQLRIRRPDVEIDWLAQDPVTRLLESAGESVHAASRWLASESAHFEAECGEHDLNAFEAIRRMDAILVNNFMVLADVLRDEHVDLVVADEAWETDYFLHENPELKLSAYAWLSDFVGWLPMPAGGAPEAWLTADYNAEMIEHRARYPGLRDRSIFVGNPQDVVAESFGADLPRIDEWTRSEFSFSGYIGAGEPPGEEARAAIRRRLRLRADERLCVVAVGGTGVGHDLLRRVADAVPVVRRHHEELRFLVVTGPRIDPGCLPRRRGMTVRGYVPDLPAVLAAADLAVVQGGLSTCMELTAARVPYLYVPLRNHFEQQVHVPHRLANYAAGQRLDYDDLSDPDRLSAALDAVIGAPTAYRPVETDGAARAAGLLAELV